MTKRNIKISNLILVLIILICSLLLISCNSKQDIDDNTNSITIIIEGIYNKNKGILYGHEKGELYSKYFLDFNKNNLDISSVKVDDTITIKYKEIDTSRKPATIFVESFE